MTNFAACRSKRSFARQNAIREAALNKISLTPSVISSRLPFKSPNANGQHFVQTDRISIYSGHSSSTLSRASSYQRSVSSSNSSGTVRTEKCGLCKEEIKFFREEFICGHVFHGECLWRYEKINPSYDQNQCPKKCLRRLMEKCLQFKM